MKWNLPKRKMNEKWTNSYFFKKITKLSGAIWLLLLGPVCPLGCPALEGPVDCWALLGGDGLLRPLPLAVKTFPSTAVVLTTDGFRSWRCGDVGDLAQLTLVSPNDGSLEGIPNPPDVELLRPLFAVKRNCNEKNDCSFRFKTEWDDQISLLGTGHRQQQHPIKPSCST